MGLLAPLSATLSIPFVVACKCKPSCPSSSTSTRAQWIASRRLQQRRASQQVCTRASLQTVSGASALLLCLCSTTVAKSTLRRSKEGIPAGVCKGIVANPFLWVGAALAVVLQELSILVVL